MPAMRVPSRTTCRPTGGSPPSPTPPSASWRCSARLVGLRVIRRGPRPDRGDDPSDRPSIARRDAAPKPGTGPVELDVVEREGPARPAAPPDEVGEVQRERGVLGPARSKHRGGAMSRYQQHRAVLRQCADRKSTRLNSSHGSISYAVFCLKKKKTTQTNNLSEKTSSTQHHKDS